MTDLEKRRRRPAVSCTLCRRRKIKCDRKTPCSNCLRSQNGLCVYENHLSQSPTRRPDHNQPTELFQTLKPRGPLFSITSDQASFTTEAPAVNSTSASTPTSQASNHEFESMKKRILELEDRLRLKTLNDTQPHVLNPNSTIETTESSLAGTFHIHNENNLVNQTQSMSRTIFHKNRLFGQSHWCNGVALFRDILETIEPLLRGEASSSPSICLQGLQRCKALGRLIKSQRAHPVPTSPIAGLPSKDVADKLVDCYLRTTETLYRILHIPTFKKDYEALWVSELRPNPSFLIQVKLVLAIGTIVYDERFSLRSSAVKWVHEAQAWFSEPEFKSRLSIQSLQINLLLLLARETASIGQDMVWVSAGALLRTAIYMGLHRDPASLPNRTRFSAEMRRRIWNTILEISLQSSIHCGGPPLISLDDFDTEQPGNFDDDQLLTDDPIPWPEENYTDMSVAIALRKTFKIRLAITKFLNHLASHSTYEETLQLDTELRAAHKSLSQTLRSCTSSNGRSPSRFVTRMVDIIMRRYMSSLHTPFFGPALQETVYAFSRKVVVETSLKIWYTACPLSSVMGLQSSTDYSSSQDDLERFVINGSGFFRIAAFKSAVLIAIELKLQLQEEEDLGSVPFRPDLFAVLDNAKAWNLRTIQAGEVSIKGCLLISLVAAYIDGVMRGVAKHEFPALLVKAAEDTIETCSPMLEEMAAQYQVEGSGDFITANSSTPDIVEDWDFMMPDDQFNLNLADPMSWMFNDKDMNGPVLW